MFIVFIFSKFVSAQIRMLPSSLGFNLEFYRKSFSVFYLLNMRFRRKEIPVLRSFLSGYC